jgi:FAD/FMN-containing dehydrogenase
MTTSSSSESVKQFTRGFSGQFLRPGDPGYDDARRVHNGMVDKRPAFIARCQRTADIVAAISFAHENNLEVSVRGGGHNVAGRAVTDGGLMIDLSAMKAISVDPAARTMRAQGGALWKDVNQQTQQFGLATTGGVVSTTGVAGLTLGGGVGWLMGMYGVAVDTLVSVELVTADGRVRTVSKEEEPDLFWAVRGAGANFGVATSFQYRLHEVGPPVTGGLLAHPFEKTKDVLRLYRDVMASAPDELYLYAVLLHAPEGPPARMAGLAVGHFGPPAAGEVATRPLKAFGSPVMDTVSTMSYSDVNMMLDAFYPRGIFYYWKARFLTELSDDAIETIIDCYERCPVRTLQIAVEPFHGEVTRIPVSATAFPHRAKGHLLDVLSQWTDSADTERCIAWTRETYAAMEPFMANARYSNYMALDEGDAAAAAYGANYERLRSLKTKYDPGNFFHMNLNIRPYGDVERKWPG